MPLAWSKPISSIPSSLVLIFTMKKASSALWSVKAKTHSTRQFVAHRDSAKHQIHHVFHQIDQAGKAKNCWLSAPARLLLPQNPSFPYLPLPKMGAPIFKLQIAGQKNTQIHHKYSLTIFGRCVLRICLEFLV